MNGHLEGILPEVQWLNPKMGLCVGERGGVGDEGGVGVYIKHWVFAR